MDTKKHKEYREKSVLLENLLVEAAKKALRTISTIIFLTTGSVFSSSLPSGYRISFRYVLPCGHL